MSGHSKWNNIKRTKAKSDAEKGKIFTKLGRELAVIVKEGGADPILNPRLKDAITKAKQSNMPNDTITRSIKKASGELGSINYENMNYEGYGIAGSAVIVKCLTDNKNRTAGDLRHFFDKFGGSLGTNGSVSFMFDNLGIIEVLKTPEMDVDVLMMTALEAGAKDVVENCDEIEIITDPTELHMVKENLEKEKIEIENFEIRMVPQNYVMLNEEQLEKFNKMIENFEDLDDVQEVFHNVDMPDVDFEEE